MKILKQSTAVTFRIGPFLDKDDGVTEETALSLVATDVQISKNGAAYSNKNSATAPSHDSDGWYSCVFDTTDTNTLGYFAYKVHDNTTHLPVWDDKIMVVPANVYDSLVGGSDVLDANVTQWLGTAAATPTTAGVPEVDATHWAGTATTISATSAKPEVDVASVHDDATAASNLESACDNYSATRGLAGTALPAAAADAAGGLPISDAGGLDMDSIKTDTAAILVDTGTTLDGKIDTIDTNVDAILVDTGTTLDGKINTIDTVVDTILVDTADMQPKLGTPAADISADIAAVKTDTGNIETDTQDIQTRLPAALVGGRMDSDVEAINNDTDAADNLAASAKQITPGTVDTATNGHTPTTTEFQADDITEATDDHYNGRTVIFTSGVLLDQMTDITDYTNVGGIGQFTVTAMTEAPSNNDTFRII